MTRDSSLPFFSVSGPKGRARRAAWDLLAGLCQGRDGDVPLPVLLDRISRKYGMDSRDTGLCMELVYGVLRTERRLFLLASPFLKDPQGLPKSLVPLLLMGAYELLFLDHIPARATLNEIVGLARSRFGRKLGGLLNAVLRNMDREADRLRRDDAARTGRDREQARVEDIAVAGSLPLWLAALWAEQYGFAEAWDMAMASTARPVASWRLNPAHPRREETIRLLAEAGASPVTENGVPGVVGFSFGAANREIEQGRQAQCAAWEAEGRISRQGMGSAGLAAFLAERVASFPDLAGAPLWDACCGRGGKSCALLERGVRVSLCSDPAPARLEQLSKDIARLGLPMPEIVQATAQEAGKGRIFPLILLDVPCSGTGTLARNPELRLRLAPARLEQLEALQAEILEAAWVSLVPGGLLAYVTCALNKRENEEQAEAFAARHSDSVLVERRLFRPALEGQDRLFLALIRKR